MTKLLRIDPEEFLAYCRARDPNFDATLEAVGKMMPEKFPSEGRKLTQEEIDEIVAYEMSVDDMGNPLK